MKYYSASTQGFYAPGIHDEDNMPDDVVELTDEQWMALLEEQSAGKQIVPDGKGAPVAVKRRNQ